MATLRFLIKNLPEKYLQNTSFIDEKPGTFFEVNRLNTAMTQQPTFEDFMALQEALQTSFFQQEKLTSELRIVSTERDLFKQRLDKLLRKFFAAKSEARGTEQKDMFFNEAEALAAVAQATPALQDGAAGEDSDAAAVAVPAHQRLQRGRKPLDADLPRHIVRYDLPDVRAD